MVTMTVRGRIHQARRDTYVGFWRAVSLLLVAGVVLAAVIHACGG